MAELLDKEEILKLEPLAEGLFRLDNGVPVLLGGKNKETGKIVFPMPSGAEAERFDVVPLKRTGKLWSWTVQRFRPKTPPYRGPGDDKNFQPYAVGYVELEDQVIVETRIMGDPDQTLKIGMEMELALEPFELGDEDKYVSTFAFKPVA